MIVLICKIINISVILFCDFHQKDEYFLSYFDFVNNEVKVTQKRIKRTVIDNCFDQGAYDSVCTVGP